MPDEQGVCASASPTALAPLRGQAPPGLEQSRSSTGAGARPYRSTRYDAFRVTDGRTYPVRLSGLPGTLQAVVDAALTAQLFCHKEQLVIRETDDAGKVKLHLYAVKRKSAPDYVWRGHIQYREHRLYVAPICILDGNMLAGEGE